ncbi:TraB family protein [Hibiscus syriacus]|uniref:TraB family protein n=1 Tax=Hibiscus syriacus TaxID=106335 RepID=A0A6A3CCT0_HIBSY|nr:TraB family protein [Hibiscus syriacus]KAE8724992.1 TraB family protein [Hibiscus syriacus]
MADPSTNVKPPKEQLPPARTPIQIPEPSEQSPTLGVPKLVLSPGAAAYDVAAIALKGPNTDLNFPGIILSYPQAVSTSATDIRAAAAQAAAARLPKPTSKEEGKSGNEGTSTTSSTSMQPSGSACQEYIDEEELLNFPNLMVDMAGGMLVSPPSWINSPPSDDSPDNSDAESLWNYP